MNPPKLEQLLDQYDYEFPEELIANAPANSRDSARLLVYDRNEKKPRDDVFQNILEYLPKNSVLVLNETKVIPARFYAQKSSGGKVEMLYITHTQNNFHALSKKPLAQGDVLTAPSLELRVIKKLDKGYEFKPSISIPEFLHWLEEHGETPIPPYIKNVPLSKEKLKAEYQTVFAKTPGSSAAPTASLHFTEELLEKIQSYGIPVEKVVLHVGLGTFAPLTEKHITEGKLHHEYYEIPEEVARRLEKYKKEGRAIIAVGTTVVRTLESASDEHGNFVNLAGNTTLFIQEPYTFKFVNGIITNFHVPRSSLLMLVSAFVGREKTLELYRQAVQKKYRLFSFGDGMLLL